ncbi:helix-turn-helix transcriptional regulator [Mycolicibacterium komossense]|uniref:AAA family ATPase n=1 Tax=Mycolicibacterium komossense TaxID=1779 RepID=A0ABT3CK68_9MYCO|nr:LuxR family transcriptional regulator [Mycolicibacterium komossense]MCV7229822.1 AAA family ATPase [Mycolicibacterium komossense]
MATALQGAKGDDGMLMATEGRAAQVDDEGDHPPPGKIRAAGRPPRLATPGVALRGRAEQLSLIDRLLDAAQDGNGSVLVIEGPPGIGKSRLVEEVLLRARRAGARPLSGKAYEDQQTVPFAPLFEAIIRTEPPLCDGEVLRQFSSTAGTPFWALHDLQEAIAEAAALTPLAICLDDVHWADAGTTVALQSLVAGLARSPVVWTFAMRSAGGRPEVRDAVNAIMAGRGTAAHHVSLGAVDVAAVGEIAGDVVGARIDESVIEMAGLAHGNPFLILETLRGLHEEDRIRVSGGRAMITGRGLPQRLAATMQQRLERLSPAARRIVHVASILPEKFSTELLARALGHSAAQMVEGLDEAARGDLLTEEGGQFRFRHDLLRRAAQQTLPRPLRRAMEREAATLLLELGAAPEEVAVQLARSADVGDLAAVASLRQAARTLSNSDPSGAADLSQRALDLLHLSDGIHATVVGETVFLLNHASRFAEAELLATSTLSGDVPAEDEAQIRLGLSIASSYWPGQRADQNRRALQLTGVSAVTRAQNQGWLAYNLANDGLPDEALDAAHHALRAAEETNDLQTRLIAESALITVECAAGYEQRCLERASNLLPLLRTTEAGVLGVVASSTRISALIATGHLAEAQDAISGDLNHAQRLHNPAGERVFKSRQALCDFAAGRLQSARDSLTERLPEGTGVRQESVGGRSGLMILGAIAAHTDDRALHRQVGIAARQGLDGGPAVRRESMITLAHAAWQRGNLAEAARWLGEDVTLLTPPTWPMDLDYVILAARVARSSSDAGLRQRVVAALDVLTRDHRQGTLYGAVALHARGLIEDDRDALETSMGMLADSSRPLLHAGAAEDLGREIAKAGDRDLAARRLGLAFDVYAAHGATADARRTAQQLSSLGVQRRVVRRRTRTGWDSLTDSELRVLELVADGATNREAAQAVGVSPHTINTQLRNVFTKLGIHSRAELIRQARGR